MVIVPLVGRPYDGVGSGGAELRLGLQRRTVDRAVQPPCRAAGTRVRAEPTKL
jgi:hypothetical protein